MRFKGLDALSIVGSNLSQPGSSPLQNSGDVSLAAVRVMTGLFLLTVGYGEFADLSQRPLDLILYSQWLAGVLLLVGLLTPAAGLLGAMSLLVSAVLYSRPGLLPLLPWLLLTFICFDLALRGGGRYSVDAFLTKGSRRSGATGDLKQPPGAAAGPTEPSSTRRSAAASIDATAFDLPGIDLAPDHPAKQSARRQTYQRAKSAGEIRQRLFRDSTGEHHKGDDAE